MPLQVARRKVPRAHAKQVARRDHRVAKALCVLHLESGIAHQLARAEHGVAEVVAWDQVEVLEKGCGPEEEATRLEHACDLPRSHEYRGILRVEPLTSSTGEYQQ
eukprot:4946292-Prymnesium_polylepis.1